MQAVRQDDVRVVQAAVLFVELVVLVVLDPIGHAVVEQGAIVGSPGLNHVVAGGGLMCTAKGK